MVASKVFSKLGVSAIAWDPCDDAQVALVLEEQGICFVDVAPTKYSPWSSREQVKALGQASDFWKSHGISIRAFQSLLFGADHLNILRKEDWRSLGKHFEQVWRLSDVTGASTLVFGSPKNRVKSDLDFAEAQSLAREFFWNLSIKAASHGVKIALEPNPKEYGCDFINSTTEALKISESVGLSNFGVNLDLGTCLYEDEDPSALYLAAPKSFLYVHLATTGLQPIDVCQNPKVNQFIQSLQSAPEISIEQRPSGIEPAKQIRQTLEWLLSKVI